MDKFHINNILKLTKLTNELDLERAISLSSKLRVLIKEDNTLKPIRLHLIKLIKDYEKNFWVNETKINEEQIKASDKAEQLVELENKFIQKRKEIIKNKLNQYGLYQQDLANLLGHRKNYMSELINGLRPFSSIDIIIIHRLLKIKLEFLMSPFLKDEIVNHIEQTISELKKPELNINKKDIEKTLT
ncbi:MAG: helix-turn-helix domain-containing protein [Bacteroidia bacterium]